MIAIRTTVSDRATPVTIAISSAVKPARLNPVVGRSVVNTFRDHLFAADNSKPNALGGARTHFYAGAARATHFDVVADGVLVSVNQLGLRQRVLGGTIKPKRAKFLTIPARAEAYGKRAAEFNDLVVVFGAGGQPVALARAGQTLLAVQRDKTTRARTGLKRSGSAGGEILFWLRKEVTQRGDPSVVPERATVVANAQNNVGEFIAAEAARARQGSGPA